MRFIPSAQQSAILANAQRVGGVGAWSFNLVTGELVWSEAIYELFGVTPAEFPGTFDYFRKLILAEDLAAYDSIHSELCPSQPTFQVDYRVHPPDGRILYIYERGRTEFDAAGKPISRAGMMMDITEQHAGREKLAANATLLRIAGRVARLGGWTIELATRELTWSDENCRIHDAPPGYKPTLEEGLNSYAPESRRQVEQYVEQCASHGIPYDFELPKLTLQGRLIWVRSIGEAVRDADGKIIRLQGAIQDITDRKKAQETVQLLSSAVEQSKESIVITDANLDFPGPIIIFVNPAFTAMTGYTAEEVLGRSPRFMQGPRTDRSVMQRLRQNLSNGEVFDGETYNYRKDGSEFLLEWQIAPIRNASGQPTHYVAIQRDISQRRWLETQLFQSQKLESVGKLAGGIAHEFNSIMTVIIGHIEFILEDLPPGDPLRTNASEIYKAANRVASLTRQLLAYGRKQRLQPELLDLNLVLSNMEGVIRHFVGGKSEVRFVLAANLHPVKVDAGKVEQVIMNIVMNAADALPENGRITLETSNVTVDPEMGRKLDNLKPGHYVLLSIADNGAGMSEEAKARLFEPFFTTKETGKGTGLGLAASHGIVKQSGGHISVESKFGHGSTFFIYLPQSTPAGNALNSAGLEPSSANAGVI